MTLNRKTFLLTFSALALLSGCDDGGTSTGWLDWIKQKDEPQQLVEFMVPSSYVRETQAGNYLAGRYAQYRQDWITANTYLDKLIRMDPTNIDLQQRAMILAMQAGDANRAIMLARRVLDADDKNLLALLFIGVDQISRQEYSPAVRTLQKMPDNGIADFMRPILIAWAEAPEKKPEDEVLVASGALHAYHALLIADYKGKVTDPEKYFVNVLAGGGADIHILEMMADAYARQGYKDLAKRIYDTLLAQYAESETVSSRSEAIQAKANNLDSAKTMRIQTPAQGAAEAFYNIARTLYQDSSDDSALVFARIAQHLDPQKDDAKLLIARMMNESGHPDDAIALYKSIRPDSAGYLESQRSAAELLEKQGKIDEAISYLEETYRVNKDVNALIQIGDVYRRAERHLDAITAYDRAEADLGGKISSTHWNLLYARGMSYERSGNFKRAESDLTTAMEFKPEHPYLLNYLGYSWADQGKKLDQALALITKAANLMPEDGYIIDSLGWVYYKMGQYDEAAKELEKAVELVPYDQTINEHLGDAYWQVGRKNEARFQWQRAMNAAKDEKAKAALEIKISEGLKDQKIPVMEAKTVQGDEPVKR